VSGLGDRIADMSPLQVALAARQLEPKFGIMAAEPLAIVGMACRFPGANNPEEFWRLLYEGREANREVPPDRWNLDAVYDPDPKAPGKMYNRRAAFLDRIDLFDAQFFGISPREASTMDPQQRILLEVSWEALESANQPPVRTAGSPVGVFVGMCTYDFSYWLHDSVDPASIDLYYSTGSAPSVTAGRLSYIMGLTGPCMIVDTACSSSLVALHLACQSLRARECSVALTGGVSVMVNPDVSIAFCKAGMLSRDGRCRTFDQAADGYGRGEGCGMVVLKRLSDAVADGDEVVAVVRGSAVNQDGPSGGLTVPSGPAQQAVMRRALETSGINPAQVSYVETHGTATKLGDPIEVNAIGAELGRFRRDNPLFIGAVKTNIGHLEPASGIASVIKVALALRHGIIPANLHFERPSPFIDWQNLPCKVPVENTPWPTGRRIAGVNCFGYSGTNAHVLLESAPAVDAPAQHQDDRPRHLLVLSAKSREALREVARTYGSHLGKNVDASLADICYTAGVGRAHFAHRLALQGSSLSETREKLARFAESETPGAAANHEPGVGFLFPHSERESEAGSELYRTNGHFRKLVDRYAAVLAIQSASPLVDLPDATARFILQYSLAELWRSWGVMPAAAWGSGVGELVASCASGTLSLEDGLRLAARSHSAIDGSLDAAIETLRAQGCTSFVTIELDPGRSDWEQILDSLADLYTHGVDVNWRNFDGCYRRRKVALPTYPFQRQRHWPTELRERRAPAVTTKSSAHPLLGTRVRSAALGAAQSVFEARLSPESPAFLNDHRVFGRVIVPAAAMLEMGLAAGAAVLNCSSVMLENVMITQPLILADGQEATVQTILDGNEFKIFSLVDADSASSEWKLHATGKVSRLESAGRADPPTETPGQAVPVDALYRAFAERGIEYGPCFQGVRELWRAEGAACGRIELERVAEAKSGWCLHPALLDSCFHTLGALFGSTANTYLPVGFERVRLYRAAADAVRCRTAIEGGDPVWSGALAIFDAAGQTIAELDGITIRRADRDAFLRNLEATPADWFYEIAWREKVLPRVDEARERRWLIVGSRATDEALARPLEERGDCCTSASHPDALRQIRSGSKFDGIIYGAFGGVLDDCAEALELVQAMSDAGGGRLWLVTVGAHHAGTGAQCVNPQYAALWGLGGVISAEKLGVGVVRVDLDPGAERGEQVACLLREIDASDGEDQVAWRNGMRHVARIARRAARAQSNEHVRLRISSCGTFDNLSLGRLERRSPGAGEIEIEVRATGLNFRDLLHALGMLPQAGREILFGFECAGIVTATGAEVTEFAIGQEVIALGAACMGSFVTLPATCAAPKPRSLTFEQAAALPLAYLTSIYGLEKLAHIRAGDRVLIHSVAGGVGQAALEIARRAGAEVFGTASRGKWERLRAQGVPHVMDSRTLDFADEILRLTHGEGVDIVLNSLNGRFIDEGMRALKHGGRFVEIGKIGIWSEEQVRATRPDVAYFPFDLGEVIARDPGLLASMMGEVAQAFEDGTLNPLTIETFSLHDSASGFRHMAQAKHYGKIVLTGARSDAPVLFRPDASYLVTGGTGALGMEVAAWMVAAGARRIVLASRHVQPASAVEELRKTGAEVVLLEADVAYPQGVAVMIETAQKGSHPLKGVIHAAGVLNDCSLLEADRNRFARVLAPKVDGAWQLHLQTRSLPLDWFVCFSSVSALVGTPGQGAYAAGNAFLDALAHHRRAQGLPALSVNWGPWAGAGMAARMGESYRSRLAQQGCLFIEPSKGVRALEHLLSENAIHAAVVPLQWDRVLAQYPVGGEAPLYREFAALASRREQLSQSPQNHIGWFKDLAHKPAETRRPAVVHFLEDQLRKVLGIDGRSHIDPEQPLVELGLDSLMGIELKSRVGAELGIDIPLQRFVGATNLARIAALLLERLALAGMTAAAGNGEEMEEIAL
jgi:acyl transferase domain-containing protein/NADPH:quinone reductase-like Zn-dependent oxidoreductase/acyl carrier protein